ncbi:MAG: hypothetical protein GTO12_15850 [Proteobacteria bacterium]|nr:hypothetical protein [Pseudomonadota bacterium]
MSLRRKTLVLFFLILMLIQFFPYLISGQTPKQKKIEKATLQVSLNFSNTGEIVLKVTKLTPTYSEPEEVARLLSHWYCKIAYLLPSPMPRLFLTNMVQQSLFESKLKPGDNVLRKAQIDDVVKLVKTLEIERIASSINLHLQELPDARRGLVSYLSENVNEQ